MTEPVLCPQCGSAIPVGSPAGLCPKCLVLAGLESQPPVAEPQPTQSSPPAGTGGFIPPTIEQLADKFPQLEILELLGKGGMGAVYKARQAGLDRLVALKILPNEIGGDPAFAERFTREARALARLSHPNIVAVYDFGRTSDAPSGAGMGAGGEGSLFYFVMEYVDGVNLRQAIQSGGMNPKEALAIVPQVCDALQFAHDEGIVHRDIKPENILIDKRGRVKIADFGLAKLLGQEAADHRLTGTQQVMGTLRYMAPEQMEGSKSVDHRADIYSLGVVFYELLTGELPIGRFAPPSKKVEIDVRLDEVVLRALEKEPEQRYQHASEVKTDMQSILSGVGPEACAAKPGPAAAAGRTLEPSGLAEAAEIEPRLSRSAVWGAIWGSLGVLVGVFLLVAFFAEVQQNIDRTPSFTVERTLDAGMRHSGQVDTESHARETVERTPSGPAPSQPGTMPFALFLLLALLALLPAAAPVGTTILGGMAIAQIKRSRGRIYGLPLAAADLLFYPMLLLDGIILVVVAAVTMTVLVLLGGPHGPLGNLVEVLPAALTLGIGLPLIAWVDYRIVRTVWRNVTGYQAPPKSAAAILPQPSTKPGYVKWVVVPMLVLFALWLAVSIATIARCGQPGNYEPRIVMQVQELGLALLGLALPVLLLIRWMQTLPKTVRNTLAKRLALSAASVILALVALMVFVVSPWNQPHVEEHAMTFQPKSKEYSRLEISTRFISHYRTKSPYYVDDLIEVTLRMYGRKDFLQGFMRAELADQQLTWVVPSLGRGDQSTPNSNDAPRREPLTREAFFGWCKNIPHYDLSKPEVHDEAEQLIGLIESWAGQNAYRWERFVETAKARLRHYDFGEDLGTQSYVRGSFSRRLLIAFLVIVMGFVSAVIASIWSAIVQRKRLADRPATP